MQKICSKTSELSLYRQVISVSKTIVLMIFNFFISSKYVLSGNYLDSCKRDDNNSFLKKKNISYTTGLLTRNHGPAECLEEIPVAECNVPVSWASLGSQGG